jgi:hypothetical protein
MLRGEKVDVLYTDPPWGDRFMAYFQTLKKRMDGVDAPQITHDQLYDRIGELIHRYVRGYVFIETGLEWKTYVTRQLASAGVRKIHAYRTRYQSGAKVLDNVLLAGTTTKKGVRLQFETYGEPKLEARCIAAVAVKGGIVLDPCCGMGFTAEAAIINRMRFRGNEYTQKRLDKTIAILERV